MRYCQVIVGNFLFDLSFYLYDLSSMWRIRFISPFNIQPYAAVFFFPLGSCHPDLPYDQSMDIHSLFHLSLVPLLTLESLHIILLLSLPRIRAFSAVLLLHTTSRCIFFASIFARWFPPLLLQLLCPCFIRFARTLHTWFSIVPIFRYSNPSGFSGSSSPCD